MAKEKIPEDVQILLKRVVETFDKEDRPVRERQIRTWRRLKLYWEGIQKVYWSEVNHDWRVWDLQNFADSSTNQDMYDKPVNVFRAYLESIIAALSIAIPSIKCAPDDADNPLDVDTAKAGDKIVELVGKHNNVSLLWLHALYIYCTEGMVAAYSYPKEDESYGTYSENKYEDVEEMHYVCDNCGAPVDEQFMDAEEDEFMPDDEDVYLHREMAKGFKFCPECSAGLDPDLQRSPFVVRRIVGTTTKPKTRQCIEAYGGLYIKVAQYARQQCDTPYLGFSYETHYSNVLEKYPHLRNKIDRVSATGNDGFERWARLSTQYRGDMPQDTPTVRNWWLRPSAFNILTEEECKKLKKLFPDGAKVVLINSEFADACNEKLDDCWTLTHNPLADSLYFDPLGLLLTSIQDITNDLISLVLQTIEHGIPQTFADKQVLDFDAYSQSEVAPGSIYPAKARSGQKVSDGFYEVKTAILSQEVQPFAEKVQELGQLVSGALPSLFGGAAPNSSKTAAQYAMSRAQALQRLQTPWKMLNIWWKEIFGKVIPSFISDMVDDEKFTKQEPNGSWINVFIRKADTLGKMGSVELESSEELPMTWSQKKDAILQLLQAANPVIMQALVAPENLPILAEAVGLGDITLPGEEDRQKQYEEIQLLTDSQPIGGELGQIPSVQVEPEVDNHEVHIQICRAWLVGAAGRQCKIDNPNGYLNVMLHLREHLSVLQMQMMASQMPQGEEGKPQNDKMAGPEMEKENVGYPKSA